MSCSPFDLRDFFLKELTDPQQHEVEVHLQTCPECRVELERLRVTEIALFSLRDEEIPQRIAFVSDAVFEPSRIRRWLAAFWGSSARLGFASAAMLSAALMVSALTRPAPAPVGKAPAAVQTVASMNTADLDRRFQEALDRASRELDAKYAAKTVQLVNAIEQHEAKERQFIRTEAALQIDFDQKKITQLSAQLRKAGDYAMAESGEPK
jgi:anti-sigma factor RsiW